MLIIIICLQRQFGATMDALEAPGMEECEIFKRTNPVHLIYDLVASQTSGLVEIWPIHRLHVCKDYLHTETH